MAYGKRDIVLESLEFMAVQLMSHNEPMAKYIEGLCMSKGGSYTDMELGVLFRVGVDFIRFCNDQR